MSKAKALLEIHEVADRLEAWSEAESSCVDVCVQHKDWDGKEQHSNRCENYRVLVLKLRQCISDLKP